MSGFWNAVSRCVRRAGRVVKREQRGMEYLASLRARGGTRVSVFEIRLVLGK